MEEKLVWKDEQILQLFKEPNQKEAAFTQLVSNYQERLYWHIRRMVVAHHDTDDILQEVFIKAWRHLDNFRGESSLFTWLYRIATNVTLSYLEAAKRKAHSSFDAHSTYFEHKLVAEKGYDSNKIEWKLQKAIQSLPEKQKVVFNLRYYDELPYHEMAAILETSEGALKASYHHAVKKITASLKED
jgi:RNA polymerase sigma-70 factor (ECF subfamily)